MQQFPSLLWLGLRLWIDVHSEDIPSRQVVYHPSVGGYYPAALLVDRAVWTFLNLCIALLQEQSAKLAEAAEMDEQLPFA